METLGDGCFMEILRADRVYYGNTYKLYSSFDKQGNLILVDSDNGALLGKCIECLYNGKGNKYGARLDDITYVFSLDGETSTYSHDFLFNYKKALVLVEDTSEKVIRIKSNDKQNIQQHHIFSDGNIISKLLFDCLSILHIDNYIDIITMIVKFGRVSRLCYEASKEIKAKIISSLDAPYGIETFPITPEVDKLYTFIFAKKVMYQYEQRKANRYFGMKNTMQYVGMFKEHERIGCRDNAQHTYIFQKGDKIIKIQHNDYKGIMCFNHIEKYNTNEDPCEIICKRDNEKRSEESEKLFEKEHLKHHYNVRIYKCLNIMIGKNVDKQNVDDAENEAKECIEKLWYLNQQDKITNC